MSAFLVYLFGKSIDWLFNFNGMSNRLWLFYTSRLDKHVHCTFICTFWWSCFTRTFFCTKQCDIKYSYLIQIICSQLYDIKYSYLIQIICTPLYSFTKLIIIVIRKWLNNSIRRMGSQQVPPIWVRVDLGVMAIKRYSTLLKFQEIKPQHLSRTPFWEWGSYPSLEDKIRVF